MKAKIWFEWEYEPNMYKDKWIEIPFNIAKYIKHGDGITLNDEDNDPGYVREVDYIDWDFSTNELCIYLKTEA